MLELVCQGDEWFAYKRMAAFRAYGEKRAYPKHVWEPHVWVLVGRGQSKKAAQKSARRK